MNNTNTDESLSPLDVAEQAATAAAGEHARAQEKLESARLAHAQSELAYDESGGTDAAWSAVEACASAVARAVRDEARAERAAKDAAHLHTVERIADLARRAHALKDAACLDEVLPPYLDKLTALYEQLGEAERETLAALETAEQRQSEVLHLQLEAEELDSRRKLVHPDRRSQFPRFPDMVRRRSHFPHAYIQSELTKRIKTDHRDMRVALLPAVQANELENEMGRAVRQSSAAIARYWPVTESGSPANSAGVVAATTLPPAIPAPGPMSMT